MKLEAVTVCHNYGDFLAETLPYNIQHFDHYTVVTHPDDKETIAVCNKFGVECVKTETMHTDNDAFNKGRAINLGLGHLRGLDWFLHLDADIVLPHNFRNLLHRSKLRHENIYGCDRLNVYGYEHWDRHKHKMVPHYEGRYFVEALKEFPLGARIIHDQEGYTPIGYFQLWSASQHKRYPMQQGLAEHSDVLFAAQWPRHQRVLLPEVLVYHLESNDGPIAMGANWKGRKTPRWGCCKRKHPAKPGYCPCDCRPGQTCAKCY